jgi:hypothetical protein
MFMKNSASLVLLAKLYSLMNVSLQLHEQCVGYNSSDNRKERHVLSITVVLHVVQIHINISIYYSVVHHVRILCMNLSGIRTQLL